MKKLSKKFSYENSSTLINLLFAFFYMACQILLTSSSIVSSYPKTRISLKVNTLDKSAYHINNETDEISEKPQDKTNLRQIKAEESAGSSPWSNAFNFQKSWGTQVDPRTGTLIAYTKVGSMISNLGHGPNIDLDVSYSSNSLTDPDEIGLGWSWNLTHFNLSNNQLSTSQGKSFTIRKNRNGQWLPRYHKLTDIQISGSKATHFVITYANGLRETLNHEGYEIRLEQQNGEWVEFSYLSGTHQLKSISDNQNHKIVLTRKKGFIIITSRDAEGKPFNVYLNRLNGKLNAIDLPKEDGQLLSVLHMDYLGHLLLRVTYPTGLQKNITYNCTDAMKVPLQTYTRGLCVVTQTSVNPDMNQPEMITRYTYGDSNANEHNYLGFNSGLNIEKNSDADSLFETPASYIYKTTEDNGITRQIRTYNKYHLLIDAKIVSDRTNHLLTEVHDFFCNTTESDGCAQSKFADLPATYSLPLKIVTRNQGENSGPPATEITEQQYDSQGRLVSTTDAYGRMEKITYCPTEGDNSCPSEPSDWSLSTQVESVTQYPSYKVPGSLKLPLIVQHNYYKKELNISGNGYILVLASKTIKSGNQYTEIKQEYYNDPQDTFKYGLLKGTTVTGTTSSLSTFHSVTKHYYYILNANHTTKTVYGAIKLESGQFKRSAAVITSLFTNQTIENVDTKNTKVTRYHYDHWGRIIQVDSNADTIFSTSTHYIYRISPQHIQLIVTNSHGLSKKIIFDGAGRQLKIFTEAISEKGKALPGIWLPVTSMDYDAYGRVISQHAYHLDTSKKIYPFTTTFDYDLLGRVNKIHSPNKETAVKMYDDPDRCTVSFEYDAQNHYSPVLITHGNILDKPIEQMVIPAGFIHDYSSAGSLCKISNTTPAARVSYVTYDGFGRKISFTDPAGKKVTITYDDAGRVKNTIDPSGNQFHNVYNFYGQSIQKWITPANSKTQYLLASAQYNIEGALLWKTGEDGKKTTFTYTPENQIATVTMPSGHVISWKYNVIGLPVSKYVDGKESVRIDYDSATTLPVEKREITGITHWTYSDDGRIQQLDHTGENGYPDYHFSWQYDYNKNVISATDLMGNKISTDYDLLGRINAINYHESDGKTKLLKMLTYDGFSRIVKINYGSNMQSNLNYNQYGQTESVTDILADKPLSTWQYSYDKEGNITTLIHNAEDNQQAILHYKYDIANNLVAMNCSGSSGLSLCPRDTSFRGSGLKHAPVIISQNYSFNALNRMQQVKESLLNTSLQKTANKIIHYSYGYQQAPLRLKQITTQWSNNATPITANFVYDTTGNMTVDSEGNKINYNIFNQITEVLTPNGKQTHYFYDGGGREVREVTDTGNIRNLFYVGKHLLNEQISQLQQSTHTISYLGVGKAIDGMIHEYYQQNYKGDVTGVLIKTKQDHYILSQKNIYSPYGMVWHISKQNTTLPWYQKTFTGFDGEQTDPATGWQFLGASHRTYNLNQRYFVSEDPAGDGYAFGGNNPIMNSDPSGNSPKWLGTTMKVMGYVGTLGMAAFHKKWANIIGTTLVAALAVTGIGLSLYFGAPATPLLAATIGLTLDASTLSIASAAVPTNRGLNIASAIVGGMATIASLVMLGNAAVAGVSSLLGEGTAGSTISEFPVNATEGDIPATPPPDYSEAVAGNTRNIDTIKDALHNKLRRFIWHNTDTDEDIVRINSHKKIDQVWKILQRNFFSDNTKHIDKISALLMIGREIATNQAITLDDLALFFYELPDIHSPESGTLIQGNAFFTRNEIVSDLPAHAINDQRDFAFWNSSDEGRFGYMIKVRSNIWNVYDLSTDSIGFRSLRTNGLYNTTIFERHGINQFFTFQYIYRNVDPVDDDIGCLDILACACCVCWFICAVMTDFDEL